jgi:acyl-CoA synthetase (NDP forming)
MPNRILNKVFATKHVAVIGASQKRASLGSKVLDNLQDAAFSGAVYYVYPKYKKVRGDQTRGQPDPGT